jgi:hypothetical protein
LETSRSGVPGTSTDVEPWELHSELVLVSPEVCRRALELLPERDPDAFLARPREPLAVPTVSGDDRELAPRLPLAVAAYALTRIAQTAWSGLLAVGLVIGLAFLVELLH